MACAGCAEHRQQLVQVMGAVKKGRIVTATRFVNQIGSSMRSDAMAILQRGGRRTIKFR